MTVRVSEPVHRHGRLRYEFTATAVIVVATAAFVIMAFAVGVLLIHSALR
ncbi:MAG TPA: hypothetical protein VE441_14115 [Mycobacterium sp.]|jgi:hypothetical protein|nr:hypothetical protein [Mycobacterium sp.]